jgi:hypothetical protein
LKWSSDRSTLPACELTESEGEEPVLVVGRSSRTYASASGVTTTDPGAEHDEDSPVPNEPRYWIDPAAEAGSPKLKALELETMSVSSAIASGRRRISRQVLSTAARGGPTTRQGNV